MAAQNTAAAARTAAVVPAAADELSALTATRFAMHASEYQTISARRPQSTNCLSPLSVPAPDRMRPPKAANAIATG